MEQPSRGSARVIAIKGLHAAVIRRRSVGDGAIVLEVGGIGRYPVDGRVRAVGQCNRVREVVGRTSLVDCGRGRQKSGSARNGGRDCRLKIIEPIFDRAHGLGCGVLGRSIL